MPPSVNRVDYAVLLMMWLVMRLALAHGIRRHDTNTVLNVLPVLPCPIVLL